MSGSSHGHTARASAFVTALAVTLVAALSPSLLALGTDAPLTSGLAVIAVAVAALLRTTTVGAVPVRSLARPGVRQPVAALASLVTDPVRHPVRPRAPGTV